MFGLACEKIKTEQVVCDEIFYMEVDPQTVNVGFDVPEDSIIE